MFRDVRDSGVRQEFGTGSVRDTRDGKGRYDLVSPIALKRLAQHTENGARKYGDRNWERGQPVSRYLDSAIRHLYGYLEGHRDEDHLAAVVWNAMAAIHTEEMVRRGTLPAELLDLPDYLGESHGQEGLTEPSIVQGVADIHVRYPSRMDAEGYRMY